MAIHLDAVEETLEGEALQGEVARLHGEGLSAREIAARLKPRGAHRRDVYAAMGSKVSPPGGLRR